MTHAALHLTHLRVEQLRQFRQALVLDGLAPGLNLITGPNEAGKSTLVRALRAAFFERHRSSSVEDLRPWGDSAATPTVSLGFDFAGRRHSLTKAFLGRKRCDLRVQPLQEGAGLPLALEGAEAEDHLAQLFGFQFAGRGESRPEHWGIPGLLWVEQGSGQELRGPAQAAREHLQQALQGLSAAPVQEEAAARWGAPLASSRGDALLAQFTAQRAELLTATGRPRAALADALAEQQRLQAEVQTLDERIRQYRQQVDELDRLQREAAHDALNPPDAPLRAQRQQVQAALQALEARQAALAADAQRLAAAQAGQALRQQQLQAWQQQLEEARRRQDRWTVLAQQLATAQAALGPAESALAAAAHDVARAQAQGRALRLQARRLALQQQGQQAEAEARRLAQAVQAAEQADAELARLGQRLAALPLPSGGLAVLQQAERRLAQARWQCEAAATQVDFDLFPGVELPWRQDGGSEAWRGQGSRHLSAPGTLALPGLGQLVLRPGGADLAARRQALAEADAALAALLQPLGLQTVAQAQARQAEHQALAQEQALARQALALHAPEGLAALQAQRARAQAAAQAAALALQSPDGTLTEVPTQTVPASDLSTLSLDEAEAREEQARQAERQARDGLAAAQQALAQARSQHQQAGEEARVAQACVDDPAWQDRRRQTQADWLAGQTEVEALDARLQQARAALQAAAPDFLRQDLERLGRSLQQLEQAATARAQRLLQLQAALEQAGALGLEELRDQRAAEAAAAGRRADELQRRAQALDLLCQRLQAHRQAALDRLQAPLQQRLQHYLPLLYPAARLELDAALTPAALRRPGDAATARLEQLSFGAREQLGLLSRLAYADLLREAGRPTLILLDDALVHSDAQRLEAMKRVLFDAAQRHQVLLFTCHPAHWRDLGVAARALPSPG
ncbi:AAA family ATPase [Ideonella livida]|uniref:AAA family ATPase n=1 Tax=Ideonella livida TaxID=2707176 RepID=A0A7C9TLP6_9BURK|nr:ATP-binding protein [Ideonella livida]NDY93659.1 AAA family ATPase [Ideonella livida]